VLASLLHTEFLGDRFAEQFALCYGTVVLSVCLSVLSVMLVYCGQMARWIKMPLGTEVGLSPRDIVLDGDPAPTNGKEHSSQHFSAHVYCIVYCLWYGDGAGNTTEENSSVFSLIRMR